MFQLDIRKTKEHLQEEALRELREKPIITYSADRVRVWKDAFLKAKDLPTQPQRYAASLSHFLSHISIPIEDDDILIGRMQQESFSEAEEQAFIKEFMSERGCYGKPDFIYDYGHCSFAWNELFKKGIPGLLSEAKEKLRYYGNTGNPAQIDFLQSAISMYESILIYLKRSAAACRNCGKTGQATVFESLCVSAPDSFLAAMQLYWTITFVFCAYISYNPTLSLGRPDLFLYDLYQKDIESGLLTKEQASLIIADFYAKNNLIMGRGEHQLGEEYDRRTCTGWHRILAYDAPQYLILGGTHPETGEIVANALTELFVAEIVPGYKNPVIEFRYAKEYATASPAIWQSFCQKLLAGASAMVYNDISIIPAYQRNGLDFRTAASYEHYGCNWPTIPTKDHPVHDWQGNICPVMNAVLHNYAYSETEFSREKLFSYIYDGYYNYYKEKSGEIKERYAANKVYSDQIRFYSCFAPDNIEKAGVYFENNNIIINLGTICSAIDMACAMEHLCLEKGKKPMDVIAACDVNFEGSPYLRALGKAAPKAGQDHPLANLYMKQVTDSIIDAAEAALADIPQGCKLRFCTEYDNCHIGIGAEMGATPDGRLRGMPVSQNTQPANGSAENGLTAMLSSMNHLPFDRLVSGALNITVDPTAFKGEEGIKKLAQILSVYFEKGGMQVQLSIVNREILEKARANPAQYRDLMVRVTGYSAVFVDLCERAQDEIMARDVL